MASPAGVAVQADAFLTRVVVMVDEATEPALTDTEASRRRAELVTLASSSSGGPAAAGAHVAFALRKRLKSDDATAVMNTLRLLDELMRSCPYFYRHVADDKMFRRLWRFVVPDYKSGVRAVFSRGKTASDLRATTGRPEIAAKVLVLIRAWAEELSVMYNGRYDPAAGFLIERYNSKRQRVKFPEVPKTELPWICPVGNQAPYGQAGALFGSRLRGSAGSSSNSNNPLPESLGLSEVENTVNLLENILENAQNVQELKTDVCKELVGRCRLISENLDKLSMSMDKEEQLARAVKVSEKLRRALDAFDASIRTGQVNKPIPVASKISDSAESDQESYNHGGGGASSSADYRSDDNPDRVVAAQQSSSRKPLPRAATTSRFERRKTGIDRSRSHDSHLDSLNIEEDDLSAAERKVKREEAQRRFHREYVASKRDSSARNERAHSSSPDIGAPRDPLRERDRERDRHRGGRDRNRVRDSQRDRTTSKPRREEPDSSEDRELDQEERRSEDRRGRKKELKKANSMYVGSASGAKPPKKGSKKDGKRKYTRSASSASAVPKNRLVDVDDLPTRDSEDSDHDTFARLGERFEKPDDNSTITDSELAASVHSINITPNAATASAAAAMYQTAPYGPPMMMMPPMPMPNPMSMYGSVNPMMQPNPMMTNNPLFAAYNTINPAMYYNSVNPMAAYTTPNPAAFAAFNAHLNSPFMPQAQPQAPVPPQQGVPTPQGSPPNLQEQLPVPPMPTGSPPQQMMLPAKQQPFSSPPQAQAQPPQSSPAAAAQAHAAALHQMASAAAMYQSAIAAYQSVSGQPPMMPDPMLMQQVPGSMPVQPPQISAPMQPPVPPQISASMPMQPQPPAPAPAPGQIPQSMPMPMQRQMPPPAPGQIPQSMLMQMPASMPLGMQPPPQMPGQPPIPMPVQPPVVPPVQTVGDPNGTATPPPPPMGTQATGAE